MTLWLSWGRTGVDLRPLDGEWHWLDPLASFTVWVLAFAPRAPALGRLHSKFFLFYYSLTLRRENFN